MFPGRPGEKGAFRRRYTAAAKPGVNLAKGGVLGSDSDDPTGGESKQISDAISGYLYTQTERARNIFIYRYYCSDTVKRIAGMMKISESTVNRELSRMRDELREYLKKEGIYV